MRLKIAARKSDLARLQAYLVGDALQKKHPDLEISFSFRESLGDLNQQDPLWKMPEKGVFTQDFLQDLIKGECDLVVHSWKDLPVEERPDTQIAATLGRADARDLLLVKKTSWSPNLRRLRILSSSPRRAHNLQNFLKEHLPASLETVEFQMVRGNIPTRMRKLLEGQEEGLIVAKAAVDRLLSTTATEFREAREMVARIVSDCHWMILPLSQNPSAAAQGALAIEIKRGNKKILDLLRSIQEPDTFLQVQSEREILASYGGGCHQKIGVTVLGRSYGEIRFLRGLTDQGKNLDSVRLISQATAAPKPSSKKALWPENPKESVWFDRVSLAVAAQNHRDLWVARADALPENWQPQAVVWASGLETWKKLARRGVWVHGSAEGLGEQELPRVDALVGRSIKWLKLSHEDGVTQDGMDFVATYRLNPKNEAPDLTGRTHFFWMSGSSFLRALSLFPEIKKAWHFCGPGNTFRIIENELGGQSHLRVALNHEQWLQEMLG